jgi:hypothetical protein
MGMGPEGALLKKMGLEVSAPDTGCCGMAGSFGFNPDHYELSIKAAEQGLFREVRKAGDDALIVANGFSCREQVAQGGVLAPGRRPLHIAEVLQQALQQQPNG